MARKWTDEQRAAARARLAKYPIWQTRKHKVGELTKQQTKFVESYVKEPNATKAYLSAYGPKPNPEDNRHQAWRVLHLPHVQAAIQKVDSSIALAAQGSVERLVELRDGDDAKTALLAAKGLLDTYGDMMRRQEKNAEASTTNNILITGMSDDQLLARIAELGAQGAVPGAVEAEVQERAN